MFYRSKLKGPIGRYYPMAILIAYVFLLIEWMVRKQLIRDGYQVIDGPVLTYIGMAGFFFYMAVFQWFRYREWIYPAINFLMGLSTLQCIQAFTPTIFTPLSLVVNLAILIPLVIIKWSDLYSHERLETNARRIFKLASELIVETSNGYTSRPYTAGKAVYTREELLGFSRILQSRYVALSLHRENGTYFIFSLNISPLAVKEPEQSSYCLFDKDGNVIVHITAKDYRQYRQNLNFDQLCDSTGKIFIRFLEYYKEGFEARITEELKSVR